MNRIRWIVGEYMLISVSGHQLVGDQRASDAQREHARAMRPRAAEAVDAAAERLVAARSEVQRLANTRAARPPPMEFDRQKDRAAATAAEATTVRGGPFKALWRSSAASDAHQDRDERAHVRRDQAPHVADPRQAG